LNPFLTSILVLSLGHSFCRGTVQKLCYDPVQHEDEDVVYYRSWRKEFSFEMGSHVTGRSHMACWPCEGKCCHPLGEAWFRAPPLSEFIYSLYTSFSIRLVHMDITGPGFREAFLLSYVYGLADISKQPRCRLQPARPMTAFRDSFSLPLRHQRQWDSRTDR
jgi:hypothetical protein